MSFLKSRFRSRRKKVLLAALLILSLIVTGGAVAATTGALKIDSNVYRRAQRNTVRGGIAWFKRPERVQPSCILPKASGTVPAGAKIELRASE